MSFADLGLIEPLQRALRDEGYSTPTPIQAQAINPIAQGRDLLGVAQTGTGKTAAFALPILQRLQALPQSGRRPIRCLVLTPTRELAAQVGDSFATYGKYLPLRHAVIFGGVGQGAQVDALRRGVDVLVACPGRLLDLYGQRLIQLDQVSIAVLDEADRMLDMGFLPDVKRILGHLPKERQNLLFSATMPSDIRALSEQILRDPTVVTVAPVSSAAETVSQQVFLVPRNHKLSVLTALLDRPGVDRCIVFTRTKHGADKVTKKLEKHGIGALAIHGNKSQNQRQRALDAFRDGSIRALVATDIAARGLDIDGLSHVINFDIPHESETYVHRIGRTGRAGSSGTAWSLCDGEETDDLRAIEKLIRRPIERAPLPVDIGTLPPAREEPRPPRQARPQRSQRQEHHRRERPATPGGGARSQGQSGGQPRSGAPAKGRPRVAGRRSQRRRP